jgi:hypothetical protein
MNYENLWTLLHQQSSKDVSNAEVLKMRGAPPPRGALLVFGGGASCLYKGHIYFERNMDARKRVYFDRHFAWLKYFTYHLVPALAPNYKQHILLPAKVSYPSVSQHADK